MDEMHLLQALRRELHRFPEVGLRLPRTQAAVVDALAGLPLEITLGDECSSVVAVLRGAAPDAGLQRSAVLLRADMDALEVPERSGVPYASTYPQRMHACGHDLHMAMLVGAAHELCRQRDYLPGDVVFAFQPGEEGHNGARVMLREGLMEAARVRIGAAFALHVFTGMATHGTFLVADDWAMAAAKAFRIDVFGRGGHASAPHRAASPIPAASMIALELDRVSHEHESVVLTVGEIHAGFRSNVIPAQAHLTGTVRYFDDERLSRVQAQVASKVREIAEQCGLSATIEYSEGYPATRNDPAMAAFARGVITETVGATRSQAAQPIFAAEDFSRILHLVPGAMIFLSASGPAADTRSEELNHSDRVIFDDAVIPDGVDVLAQLAIRWLARDVRAAVPTRRD